MKNSKDIKGLVSILIPVYNVEKYLPDLFMSIEKQKYPHIEVIFVNDGSTDNSLNLLKQFCRKHKYATIICQKNKGLPAARNTALKAANGQYVYIVDSDDVMNIFSINIMVNLQKQTHSDLITSNYNIIEEHNLFNELQQKCKKKPKLSILSNSDLICSKYLSKFKSNFSLTLWNKLMLMKNIKKIWDFPNVWDEKIQYGEDVYFLSKYLLTVKKVCCVKDNLYYYRQRNESMCNQTFNKKFYQSILCLKNFLSLDPIKYKKTVQKAKAQLGCNARWILTKMYYCKYIDHEKINWLFSIYQENWVSIKKYFHKPIITMYFWNRQVKKIYNDLTQQNTKNERKN